MDPFDAIKNQMQRVNAQSQQFQQKKPPGLQVGDSIVRYVDSGLTDEQMAELRQLVDESHFAGSISTNNNFTAEQAVRRSQVHWLDMDKYAWVYHQMQKIAAAGNEKFQFRISGVLEQIQLAIYDESEQGFYRWHMDWGAGAHQRRISVSVPINDPVEFDGGELEFNYSGDAVKAEQRKGQAVVFPSFLLHRVTPVTRGRRYSLVAWFHGVDF